jgi:hypothetical protein
MFVRGDEGVDIDIREECSCEMGDGLEEDREACRVFGRVLCGSTNAIGYKAKEAREK